MRAANEKPVRDILLYPDPESEACQAVLLEDGQPCEWLDGRESASLREQDILLGRVADRSSSLECAFVDLNEPQAGMLPLKHAPADVRAGQILLVQVQRLTAPGKGCQLTARPQLPGIWTVFRPFEVDAIARTKVKFLPWQERQMLIETETGHLSRLWQSFQQAQCEGGPLPRLLHRFQEPLQQAMRDWLSDDVRSIRLEGLTLFEQADQMIGSGNGRWRSLLQLHRPEVSGRLASLYGLDDLDIQTKKRLIWLKNGGRLAFDQTEALLAVDVNSAKANAHGNPEQIRLQTNQLAAAEIARQLRLRKIQGLIVIDFIRMRDPVAVGALCSHFESRLALDQARIRIGGMTSLGLFELTRTQKRG